MPHRIGTEQQTTMQKSQRFVVPQQWTSDPGRVYPQTVNSGCSHLSGCAGYSGMLQHKNPVLTW